ncbi:hypothetical protein Bca4012_015030 [Brassica carinata]
MSEIVQMLTTSSIALPVPQPPGFFLRMKHEEGREAGPTLDSSALCSVDDASITLPSKQVHNTSLSIKEKDTKWWGESMALLLVLRHHASLFSEGFNFLAKGQDACTVFGVFLCRGDLSPDVCRECVLFASNNTQSRCLRGKELLIQYDECMLGYSDRNIFMDNVRTRSTPTIITWNTKSVPDIPAYLPDRFKGAMVSLMNKSAVEAANSKEKRFAVKKSRLTLSQTLYALVQCIPDLSPEDCLSCLQQSMKEFNFNRVGGRVVFPSCNSRYEIYPFYNEPFVTTPSTSLPVTAPPSPPVTAPPLPPGKVKNSLVIILATCVPVSVFVLFLVAVSSYQVTKRVEKTDDTADDEGDDITTAGSLQFDFKVIEAATNKFSICNKLGQGGFGKVYKYCFSGYMSPEYAMYGQFSMKSDVYSFGVLVLEIISGRKNSSLHEMDGSLGNLVTYTRRVWNNGSPLELVDSSFRENYQSNEIIRCIHIALLCVQEDTEDRPTMSAIVQMLTTSSIALAVSRPPGFFFRSKKEHACSSMDKSSLCSIDQASITSLVPR